MKNKKYLSFPKADTWHMWYCFQIKGIEHEIVALEAKKLKLIQERLFLQEITVRVRKKKK